MAIPRTVFLAAAVLQVSVVQAFDTVVVFNEIHYHPAGADNPGAEFVEIYNQQSVDIDLSGWRISGGIDFEFRRGTVLEGGGYLVVAADPAALQAAGVTNVTGPYTGFLENAGERLRLRNLNDRIMDEVEYNDRSPWPIGADGSGASLSKIDPDTKGAHGEEWMASLEVGGTPGAANTARPSDTVFINELAGSTSDPGAWFIELYNPGENPAPLAGALFVSESGQEYVLPAGTSLAGGAHLLVSEAYLGFRVADNDNLYLFSPNRESLLDAVRADDRGRARHPDGGEEFHVTGSGNAASPGSPNPAPARSPIVINEIMYHHAVTEGEEWVELFNTLDVPVPVGGWKLDGAVRFTIPPGVTIPEGGYLVIAKDSAAVSAKFPEATVVGDFSGSLSNRGEDLLLIDEPGSVADRVYYRDGAPWPGAADGGGSSLELRNPFIENADPAAWAASDNAERTAWQNYEFDLRALLPTYTPNIFNFHELRIGLLDSGIIMLDDFSVVEDPGGANIELMANGGFDTPAGWRLLGTHKVSRFGADEGDRVLRLVAEGRMNYLNNLIECNLTQNGNLHPVQIGKVYRVSFRAKWISGSPQFRFELFYNRLAKTVILPRPEIQGTPGVQNSVYTEETGPIIQGLTHAPVVPGPGEDIEVSAAASDPDGVASMTLRYSLNGGGFSSIDMALDPDDGRWAGVIPGQPGNTVIQFYVQGNDPAGLSAFAPAGGRRSRALIKVDSSNAHGDKHSIRIVMLPSESSAMHASADILSNHRFGCTLITDEQHVAYDSGIRLRGSMFSRNNSGTTALNLKFPADRRYRGVHSTITTRRGNRREILVKHIINAAGGIHDNYNDILYQYGHIGGQTGPVRTELARFGSPYLRGLPGGNGTAGTVFKMEGIREFQATQGGPEGAKLPFPIGWIASFDLADQGDDKEMYRHNMRINSIFEEDDYSSIISMCQTFSRNGQALEDAVPHAIDVDRWTRQFAALSLCGIGDTYSQGNPHNLNFYVRPDDGIVEPIPWDWDFTFSRSASSPLWGNRNVSKIFARPVYSRLFYGHLYNMIRTVYNDRALRPWFEHYGECSGESYVGNLSYVSSRGAHVLNEINSLLPSVPFTITTNSGERITTAGPTVTIEGVGWIDVREIRVGDSPEGIPVTWTDVRSWEVTIPVEPGLQTLELTAIEHTGRPVGTDSIEVDVTGSVEPAAADNLAISELNYNPAGVGEEEFIEILNISPSGAVVDLTGVSFVNGIEFSFAADTRLNPGERLLLVEDLAAFEARYGAGLPVAGVFANDSRLNNGGERLRLETIAGETIRDFSYDNNAPWPSAPDGGGFSLVLIAPESDPDHADPSNWRSSAVEGGNPNASDALHFAGDPDADDNGDGLSNLMNYALGPGGRGPSLTVDSAGRLVLTHPRNLATDDLRWAVELSEDLELWSDAIAEFELISETAPAGGRTTVVLRSLVPLDPAPLEHYARLRVEQRP